MKSIGLLSLFATALLLTMGNSACAQSLTGTWLTEDGSSRIQFQTCVQSQCGQIIWLREPIDPETGKAWQDKFNADGALKRRPLLGLALITDLARTGAGHWEGNLYNPLDGHIYAGKLTDLGNAAFNSEDVRSQASCVRPKSGSGRISTMMRSLKALMLATDVGLLLYWGLTAMSAFGVFHLPSDWMFADYSNATIRSWNWSFLPLDIVLSISGLASLRLSRRDDLRWRPLAILSLAMTVCAGLMAISFWAIRGDFSAAWWGCNLFLMPYPIPFLIDLIACQPARPPPEGA
jgi:hypothetical protein